MQRRQFIAAASSVAAAGLAGCGGGSGSSTESSGGDSTDSMSTESTDSMSTESTDSGSGGSGSMDINVESPESPEAVVEAWYNLNGAGMDAEARVEAQNTLLHTESTLYPMEVRTSNATASGGGSSQDIQFEGVEIGETTTVESIQQDAPQLMGLSEDLRTQLVEEGELTKVPTTPQYSGDDAPEERQIDHFVAKEDGEWRLVQ